MVGTYYSVETIGKIICEAKCFDGTIERAFEDACKIYGYVEIKHYTENSNGIFTESVKIFCK